MDEQGTGTPRPRRALGPLPDEPDTTPQDDAAPSPPADETTARPGRRAILPDDWDDEDWDDQDRDDDGSEAAADEPTAVWTAVSPSTGYSPSAPRGVDEGEPAGYEGGHQSEPLDGGYQSDPLDGGYQSEPLQGGYEPDTYTSYDPDATESMALRAGAMGADGDTSPRHDWTGTPPAASDTSDGPDDEDADASSSGHRTRNIIVGVVAAVLVLAIILVAIFFLRGDPGTTGGPDPSPTPSETPAVLTAESMLAPADLAPLGEGWTETLAQDRIDSSTPRPNCITPDAEGLPLASASMVRQWESGAQRMLQEAFTFANPEEATKAANLLTTQLGACERPVSWLRPGLDITGVGDSSAGVVAVVQDDADIAHSVTVSRTGNTVHILDHAKPEGAANKDDVAAVTGTAVAKTCEAAGGTCAESPAAETGVPPKLEENPQFLAGADIPRITPGAGRWGGTEVSSEFDFYGSQCEGRDLAALSGPQKALRTYLLQEDANAPEGVFGVDELILTYEDADGAEQLISDMGESINGCADAMLTADVTEGEDLEATGANGEEITGQTWTVTQSVDESTAQYYRLALIQVEDTVIYTVLTSTEDFDFSDGQWQAVGQRAGQRYTQGAEE